MNRQDRERLAELLGSGACRLPSWLGGLIVSDSLVSRPDWLDLNPDQWYNRKVII